MALAITTVTPIIFPTNEPGQTATREFLITGATQPAPPSGAVVPQVEFNGETATQTVPVSSTIVPTIPAVTVSVSGATAYSVVASEPVRDGADRWRFTVTVTTL